MRAKNVIWAIAIYSLLLTPSIIAQSEKPNFGGSFTLKDIKGGFKQKVPVWTLEVIQTESTIEVTRVIDSIRLAYNCPLKGGEGKFSTPDGGSGTCKAQWKGNDLVLDKTILRRPRTNGPESQTRVWERWKLSPDLRTLTIKIDVNFPGTPISGSQLFGPTTEVYARN